MTTTKTGFESLAVQTDGATARIVLRRPPLNILDAEMIDELNAALSMLGLQDELRVLVLAAEGRAFSAGVAVEDHLPHRVRPVLGGFHNVFRSIRDLGVPTVAAVQGPALGGGCELACFADLVIAGEAATFGLPEIKLGVFPPVAAVHFPQRIGVARTLRLVLSGDVLSAGEAQRIGLVDYVVATADLPRAVEAAVAAFREKSATALRLARRAVLEADGLDFDAGLEVVERLFLDELMDTEDAVEGLRSFLEKRAPAWKHR